MKIFSHTTILILFFLGIQNFTLGQSSYGANFGVVMGNNGNALNGINDSLYSFREGYQFGVLGNFGTYSFFISPGVYFKDITINNNFEKIDPFVKSPRLKIANAKVVMGYQTDILSKNIKFKVGGGVNGNYIISIDDNSEDFSFNTLEDTHWAYNFDIGIDFFIININLSYEKSIKEVFSRTPDDKYKFDYFILSAGILL